MKKELKALQDLKAECENLEVELGGLGAEKLTPVIDKKVSQCTARVLVKESEKEKTKLIGLVISDQTRSIPQRSKRAV